MVNIQNGLRKNTWYDNKNSAEEEKANEEDKEEFQYSQTKEENEKTYHHKSSSITHTYSESKLIILFIKTGICWNHP